MLKTGLSRDQLSQLARDSGLGSSNSFGNLTNHQKSFDALMSLDFQSLQSIDNLANLIQNGSTNGLNMPVSNMKNADFGALLSAASSRNNLNSTNSNSHGTGARASDHGFSDTAQRLANVASANRMNALLRSLSSHNLPSNNPVSGDASNTTLSNFLQSMQANMNQLNRQDNSNSLNLFNQNTLDGNNSNISSSNNAANQSALNLARFLRPESSTGLSALRRQDGLNERNSSSVDDFLSLIAAGDIPHQDSNSLIVPLMQHQDTAAKLRAQQQLLQSSGFGNTLGNGNVFPSFSNLPRSNSIAESTSRSVVDDTSFHSNSERLSDSASAVAIAMAQVRAAMQGGNSNGNDSNKRSNDQISGDIDQQDEAKR
jgi:hypothetical protein